MAGVCAPIPSVITGQANSLFYLLKIQPMKKTITVLIVCLALVCVAQAQNTEEKQSSVKLVTLAKNDPGGFIVEEPALFHPKDIPILCYVDLNHDNPTLIQVKYVAVKAKGIRPNTIVMTAQYQTRKGETGAAFDGKPTKDWAIGDYRVDVYINKILKEKREFMISEPPK